MQTIASRGAIIGQRVTARPSGKTANKSATRQPIKVNAVHTNQTGQVLAELLDWPQATFAATIQEEEAGLVVGREVDGGVLELRVKYPAVVTVDLRIVSPTSVYSLKTDKSFKYHEGVRFAPLPAIMQARRKPLDTKNLSDYAGGEEPKVTYLRFEPPPERKAGEKVADVDELVAKLKDEAKVL